MGRLKCQPHTTVMHNMLMVSTCLGLLGSAQRSRKQREKAYSMYEPTTY